MDLKIVYKDIDDLMMYENNPRKNEDAVDVVAKSIQEFGFKNPIIIDKNNEIVAGHTRILAARKLGLKTVPTVSASDLTETQIKAFRIADNRTAELSQWNFDLLEMELDDLKMEGFDIDITGFTEELKEIMDIDDLLEEVDVTMAIENPIWLTVRTSESNKHALNEARRLLRDNGIRSEVSYD